MSLPQILWALACVVAISLGQVLFKRTGMAVEALGTWWAWPVLMLMAAAGAIYLSATFAWINLLRHVPLASAYSFMALSFVIVPLAGYWLFEERLGFARLAGSLLIIAGLLVSTRGD